MPRPRVALFNLSAALFGLLTPVELQAQQTNATQPDPSVHQLQGVEAALAATKQKAAALAASEAALAKEAAALQASLVQRGAAAQAAERELGVLETSLASLEFANWRPGSAPSSRASWH